MVALGLLARHSSLRPSVLSLELNDRVEFSSARIAIFSGRNYPENYIWGDLATQLGQEEAIKPYWANGPRAVDQAMWEQIIGDQPTLILLDELPPYLNDACTQTIGQRTLGDTVVNSLSNLMSAALQLPKCCIVIANLDDSYKAESRILKELISNLQQETRRQAMTITPVQLAGNEIYEILKKRLIKHLPDDHVIDAVAVEFAQQVKKAENSGNLVVSNLTQIADQIRETYPFHPSFKHLIALFKENDGFRQTRGLMQFTARLLKCVAERTEDDVFLIGTQHLNLNDREMKDEVARIASNLLPAITHDIADNGDSVAEIIDGEQEGGTATQVMTLLLVSSLSRVVGGHIGLTESEIVEFLASPLRKPSDFPKAIRRLREKAWYLHREEQHYYIKETENLSRRIQRDAEVAPQPKIDQIFVERLTKILNPESKKAYHLVQILPKLDELQLSGSRVLIVIKPDGKTPPVEIQKFFDFQQEKNNFLVLTGQDSLLLESFEMRLRELYATEQIFKRLHEGDTIYLEARDCMEEAEERFRKSLSAAYDRIYFPSLSESDQSGSLASLIIDNGLKLGTNEQSAEVQIEGLLASSSADYKLALDFIAECLQYIHMAETELWPTGEDNRRVPWRDILGRAKSNPAWPWMPGTRGLEVLKDKALEQGKWRYSENDYIEKGPFPKEKTTVNVTPVGTDPETGDSILNLTPRHAGESPIVFYSSNKDHSESWNQVDNLENFVTPEGSLYFRVEDTTGQFENGPPVLWIADLTIRHQIGAVADKRVVTIECEPKAKILYTLDGTNPRDGLLYDKPFEVGPESAVLLVFAQSGEAIKTEKFLIPADEDAPLDIDDHKPVRLLKKVVLDTVAKVFEVINHCRDQSGTRFNGVRIEIGDGKEKTSVTVRFYEREITANMMEVVIRSIREVLREINAPVTVTVMTSIRFDTGFDLKEFAKIVNIELRSSDIVQEE